MSAYQGTYRTIKDSVIAKLRLDATDDEAQVGEWVNLAYANAVQETGCLQRAGTMNLTSGDSSYTLPATVAWIVLMTVTYADGSVSDPFQQVSLEQILEQRRATAAGAQRVTRPLFALVGQNQLEIWPEPGTGQVLEMWNVYLPEQLTADGDEPAIMEPYGSKLLEYGALVEGARFKKDPLLAVYEAGLNAWTVRFQVWLNRREGVSPRQFRVRQSLNRSIRLADRSADVA